MEEPDRTLQSAPAVKTRLPYLDALRVVAFIAVVVIHVCVTGWLTLPVDGAPWAAYAFFDSLTRFGVPVFFMISGALFLDPNREITLPQILKKNILRLLVAYFVWSAVYALASGRIFGLGSFRQSLHSFLLITVAGADHLWFLPALCALYLLVPFLRKITAERALTRYFLVLWLVFGIMLQSCQNFGLLGETATALLEDFNMTFVLGFIGYFMLGHYLASAQVSRSARCVLYSFGAASAFATFLLTLLSSRAGGTRVDLWYDYLTPFCVLQSAAVFLAARCAFEGRTLPAGRLKRISSLGRLSFGAYCSHMLFIMLLEAWPAYAALALPAALKIVFSVALVSACSLLVSWLLGKIPFVKKYLV